MSKSKKRASEHSIFQADEKIYQITPSLLWRGAPEFKGRVVDVVLRDDGNYYGRDGGYYIIGTGSWELVT